MVVLEDGRERLRTRLAQRGVDLSAVLLAITAAHEATAVSISFLDTTIQTILAAPSARVCGLAAKVGSATGFFRWQTVAALLIMTTIGVGTSAALYLGKALDEPKKVNEVPQKKTEPPRNPSYQPNKKRSTNYNNSNKQG